MSGFRGLMPDCFIRPISDTGGSISDEPQIFFSSMPKGLNFTRTAQFDEKGGTVFAEPLLIFKGNNTMELSLELDYVAGIHFQTVDEMMDYAARWQALPLMNMRGEASPNNMKAPSAVKLVISDLVRTRGVIKTINVSFGEDYTWENTSKDIMTGVKPMPISFRVNFTFMETYLYSSRGISGVSNGTSSGRLSKQKYRSDVLKNFYVNNGS